MKKTHIAGLIMIGFAIIAIFVAVGDASTYVSFSEAALHPGKQFHVVGELEKDKEIYYNPQNDPNFFSFYMRDNKGEVRKVFLNDAKPQDFERSEQVVTIGKVKGDEFHASQILLKCPSKYQEDEIEIRQTVDQ